MNVLVRRINTDRERTEAVIVVDNDIEIRIDYKELINKGADIIRDSFIDKGLEINANDILLIFNQACNAKIEYEYSRISAGKDCVALYKEYKENGATGRVYNGSSLKQKGAYASQKQALKKVINNNMASTVLAAEIAGMTNRVLELEDSQQLINVVGRSSSGKTTLCKGLGSVYGNAQYMVADNTDLGLSKMLGENDYLPLYADDFLVKYMNDKKSNAVTALRKLIMMLSTGKTKSSAVKQSKEFSGSFIMTSEQSIVDMLVGESSGIIGDAYRLLELPMDMQLFKSVDEVKEYNIAMNENAGFVGEMAAEYLMLHKATVQAEYDKLHAQISERLEKVKIANNINPVRCANRISSLAISYYITANAIDMYKESRLEELINYLVEIEVEQLTKYKVISLEDSFRELLIKDYRSMNKVIGKDYIPVEYTGEKQDIDDNFIDYDETGSHIIVRMRKKALEKYVETKKLDKRAVFDMLRNNRNSNTAKIKALQEGNDKSRIDKKFSDLSKRVVAIEIVAA